MFNVRSFRRARRTRRTTNSNPYPSSSQAEQASSSSPPKARQTYPSHGGNQRQSENEEYDSIRTQRYVRDDLGYLQTVDGVHFGSDVNAARRQDALTDDEGSIGDPETEPMDLDEVIMEDVSGWVDEDDGVADAEANQAAKKPISSTRPPGKRRAMDIWKGLFGGRNYSQEFLYELLRTKGRGGAERTKCNRCGKPNTAIYRCKECSPTRLICKECCLVEHAQLPLHVVRQWDGKKFKKIALRSLGLRVYLGHEDGSRCIMPRIEPRPIVVMHTTGLHEVSVRYCNCLEATPRRIQLLRFGWYPASVQLPATCATLQLLDLFHGLTLNGKLSAYNFYKTMIYLTDALGIKVPKKRYQPFLRMIRQYRHLLMMMRGGKGVQKDGANHFKRGELTLQCPACPIPSVNLPPDWMDRVDQFLYRKIVSVDACFRLTNLFRSNQSTDPSLHPGAGYMLEDTGEYGMHVLMNATQKDISTCSGFKAIAHADAKCHTGLRSTGVVAVCCSRHEMVSAQAVGNLQKGERYCNSDYAVCSALQDSHDLKGVVFSYDIVCQWIKNFQARMEDLPEDLRLPDDMEISAGIPKGHCPGHQMACQMDWAMGIQPGVGRTDGEAIERLWAFIRMCASSIKEMGPGSRCDTLDDQFGFHNWCKLIGMGLTFLKRSIKAFTEAPKHEALHADFTAHLPPDVVARWTEWIEAWEKDKESRENPYAQDDTNRDTEAKARYRVREEERLSYEAGEIPLHDTSPCGVLVNGFLIEEHQAKLRLLTDGDGTVIQAQASEIQKKRLVYMPGVHRQLQRDSVTRTVPVEVEDQELYLPSAFSAARRSRVCIGDIAKKEAEIRKGQCHDALHAMRDCERALRTLASYRRDETDGQGVRTRAQTSISTIEARRNYNADKYRRCRRALERLEPGGSWSVELRPLRDADVANMAGGTFDVDVLLPLGQGETELSWVWATETGQGEDVVESCRVEWLKSRARSLRWSEEKRFLAEEMRRVPITLEERAKWWDEHQVNEDDTLGPDIQEGVQAYSVQQADVWRKLGNTFTALWDVDGIEIGEELGDWEEIDDPEEGAELDLEVVDMAVVVVMGMGERLGSVVRKKHSESPSSRPLFGLVHPLLVEMESRQVCSYFPLAVNSYSGIDLLTVLEPRCT
ncbi:hypothetical protein BDZ89DRAFT_1138143 [Hymenopellis radicata]|nr:hypothetical protein BDZ89DRAFT_1138143 [Hymenopellis radicata]